MNFDRTDFDWQYVPARTRRRVLAVLATTTLLTLVVGAVLGSGTASEQARYFYESIAVQGQSGHLVQEIAESDRAERSTEETPPPETIAAAPVTEVRNLPQPIPLPPMDPLPIPPPLETIANIRRTDEQPAEPQFESPVQPPAAQVEDISPPAGHGGLADADGRSADASHGAQEIIEGVTAPYYRLTSLDEYERTAREYGGRFLAWNGRVGIGIGRDLNPDGGILEMLDSSWHRRYATRVAPLPPDRPDVRQIRLLVLQRYPQLGPKTQIMLALPYACDQEILRSQLAWFESRHLPVDVRAVTEGRFMPSRDGGTPYFAIVQVLRDEIPVTGNPSENAPLRSPLPEGVQP